MNKKNQIIEKWLNEHLEKIPVEVADVLKAHIKPVKELKKKKPVKEHDVSGFLAMANMIVKTRNEGSK